MKPLSLVLLIATAAGCTVPLELNGRNDYTSPPVGGGSYNADDLSNGRMAGTMSRTRNFDDSLRDLYVDSGWGYSHAEAHVLGDYGWAMIGIDADGDFGVGDLQVGTTITSRNASRFNTYVIGCAGPNQGNFEFDEPANDYTVTISEDEDSGELYLDVWADYGDNGQVTGLIPLPGVR